MKLTYHKAVQREVDAACDWYDERKDRLGDEFFQEVERTLGLIALNPQAFPLASFGRRKAHLKRFPYAVCYRILADRVRILSQAPSILWRGSQVNPSSPVAARQVNYATPRRLLNSPYFGLKM